MLKMPLFFPIPQIVESIDPEGSQSLRDVLNAAKVSGTTLKAVALNDYQTKIPLEDATKFDVIVAHQMNGAAIPVRTKGPLFIVYPFDSKAELKSTTYYERSAWQLKTIAVD